jgi:predicted RNase H-like HicB family nuclease
VKTYRLYLESGPKHMKTMVHVPELLGCIATGPTSDDAVAASPDAIRQFLGFIAARGEKADPRAGFKTKVVEHLDEANRWLGNGSPYATYPPDLEPIAAKELELLLRRFSAMREALATWAESAPKKALDATAKDSGRTSRSILLHVVPGPGGYLSPVVGGTKGFAATQSAVERGELSMAEGIRKVGEMAVDVARGTTAQQRKVVIQRPKEIRTLRKALRRMLEHDWEHLVELSRRAGGPTL